MKKLSVLDMFYIVLCLNVVLFLLYYLQYHWVCIVTLDTHDHLFVHPAIKDQCYYVGTTKDPKRRLREHREGKGSNGPDNMHLLGSQNSTRCGRCLGAMMLRG